MKNSNLRRLNFNELLYYPEKFQPAHFYRNPVTCTGFCVECEKTGVLDQAKGRLTLMSHACDTSDFEAIIGERLSPLLPVDVPVMFLLEDPGGDYGLGENIEFSGVTKKPPVKHYYFSTGLSSWPESIDSLDGNFYGSYFAYIMKRHSLADVYITNIVKCKREGVENPHIIEDMCVKSFLAREIKEFSPVSVFCFGTKVFHGLRGRFPDQRCVCLYHPSFIQNRSYTKGLSPREAIFENERRIDEELEALTAVRNEKVYDE